MQEKMEVILCTHNSGGVGKTTLAVHIAGVLAEEGQRVLLVDCDDQSDAWNFYVGTKYSDIQEIYTSDEGISVVTNANRKSLKRLVKPQDYNYVVLDMDTPRPNIVQVISGSDPNLILIPISASQKYKAENNLEDVLDLISRLSGKVTFSPQVIVVPLGVDYDEVLQLVRGLNEKPKSCQVYEEMANIQDDMQQAIYKDRKYIWNYPKYEYLRNYFSSLIHK